MSKAKTSLPIDPYTPLRRFEIHPDNADYVHGVRCVVMPCCGFTYSAEHTDGRDIYACPLCESEEPS